MRCKEERQELRMIGTSRTPAVVLQAEAKKQPVDGK
jgi:hypothetical protein